MKNNILLTGLSLLSLTTIGQVLTNNGQLIHNNGATISTVGGGIDNDGIIENNGKIIIDGGYKALTGSAYLSNESDTIFINGYYDNQVGTYDGETASGFTGTLVLMNAIPSSFMVNTTTGDLFYNLAFAGGGTKVLNGTALVENAMVFGNGIVQTDALDSLGLLKSGFIGGNPRALSHVNGPFYREGFDAGGNLGFPIGDGLRYRPVSLKNVPAPAGNNPVFGFEATRNAAALTSTEGNGVQELHDIAGSFVWRGVHVNGDYSGGANVMVSYKPIDGLPIADQGTYVVTRSSTLNGIYDNYDVSDVTDSTVTSFTDMSDKDVFAENYFLVGKSANVRASAFVLLDGSYNAGGTMTSNLPLIADELTNRYEAGSALGNPYGIKMTEGYSVPTNAVDVIELSLREAADGHTTDLDFSYAWLLEDGTIVDFYTGQTSIITFKNYNMVSGGNDYRLVVNHRNHLPIMFNQDITLDIDPSGAWTYDLTDIGNVFGGGAELRDLSFATMYPGDAETTNSFNEVNAFDLWTVDQEAQTTMGASTDYDIRDVNLDGSVNSTDRDITSWSNDQLYFSTIP